MRKKRKDIAITILCLLALGASGCAQQVEYVGTEADGETRAEDANISAEADGTKERDGTDGETAVSGVQKQIGTERSMFQWTDSYEDAENGSSVEVNAWVHIPDADQMSVVKARAFATESEADRRQIATNLFGSRILAYSDPYKPEETLTRLLERAQYWSSGMEEYLAGMYRPDLEPDEVYSAEELAEWDAEAGYLKSVEQRYRDALKQSGKEPVQTEDFSGTDYLGSYDGLEYWLTFEEQLPEIPIAGTTIDLTSAIRRSALAQSRGEKDTQQLLRLEVSDGILAHAPKQLSGSGQRMLWNDTYEIYGGAKDSVQKENLCGLTEEEAAQQAQQLLEQLGLTGLVQINCLPLLWTQEVANGLPPEIADGYELYFEPGSDGLSFVFHGQTDRSASFITPSRYWDEERLPRNAQVRVRLNGDGILQLAVTNMLVPQSATADVALLPYEQILQSAKAVFRKDMEDYDKDYVTIDSVWLSYWRTEDGDGQYTYLPAWLLQGDETASPRYVINAMDGSLLASNPTQWEARFRKEK